MRDIWRGFGTTTGVVIALVTLSICGIIALCAGCIFLAALGQSTQPAQPLNPPNRATLPPLDPRAIPTQPGPTPTPIIYQFQGSGDDVVTFNAPASGLAQFSISHRGKSNFAVKLLDSNGDLLDLLVNENVLQEAKNALYGMKSANMMANGSRKLTPANTCWTSPPMAAGLLLWPRPSNLVISEETKGDIMNNYQILLLFIVHYSLFIDKPFRSPGPRAGIAPPYRTTT